MVVFRLGSALVRAHDGTGAKLYGGRWNRKGTPVVYTSESRALCAMEVLANADELAGDYVATPLEIPDDIAVTVIPISNLPRGWSASPHKLGLGLRKAVLSFSLGHNSLDPARPDLERIRFYSPEPFYFDDRFGRTR